MAKQPVVPSPPSPHVPLFDTLVPGLGPVGLNPLLSQAVFAVKAMRAAFHFQSLQPSEDGKSMSNPKPRGWGPNTPKQHPTMKDLRGKPRKCAQCRGYLRLLKFLDRSASVACDGDCHVTAPAQHQRAALDKWKVWEKHQQRPEVQQAQQDELVRRLEVVSQMLPTVSKSDGGPK